MPIDEKKLAELKAQHGEVLSLETKAGEDVVFRMATPEEFDRFLVEHTDPQSRPAAFRTLCLVCAVYPERGEMAALLRAKPGIAMKLGDHLTDFCGLERDAVRKK
jgi:hypothetical protein